jgi:hypothetical protein
LKRITAAITAALVSACALTLAAPVLAVDFGANDDRGKYSEDGGATFFGRMAAAGLRQNIMTVRFLPGAPMTIPDKSFLDTAVATAAAAGIAPIFAVYPYPPAEIEAGAASPAAFGAWLETVAAAYPQVRTFIVGNEPNLNSFWRPQGDGAGNILSAASFGPFLAAGYDALKRVSPELTVLGLGLSPRGDDAPGAAGKTSPVHFLSALGEWYRATGRTAPLMDGLSYHPYPNPSDFTVPFSFAYGWPNASVHELDRIKQAFWDAFAGTGQPTTANGVKLYLDEVGWQVDTSARAEYEGTENVAVTSEAAQAGIYGSLVRYVVCDPHVAQVNFFGYYDERDRGGWQSALRRADGSERAANAAVADAIAATGGRCDGGLRRWSPAHGVIGAAVDFGPSTKPSVRTRRAWGFRATALEDATYGAGIFRAGTATGQIARELTARRSAIRGATGRIKSRFLPAIQFPAGTLAPGSYVYAIRLAAALNPARTSVFVSKPFRVGAEPAGRAPKLGAKPAPTPKATTPKRKRPKGTRHP